MKTFTFDERKVFAVQSSLTWFWVLKSMIEDIWIIQRLLLLSVFDWLRLTLLLKLELTLILQQWKTGNHALELGVNYSTELMQV